QVYLYAVFKSIDNIYDTSAIDIHKKQTRCVEPRVEMRCIAKRYFRTKMSISEIGPALHAAAANAHSMRKAVAKDIGKARVLGSPGHWQRKLCGQYCLNRIAIPLLA